MWQDIKNLYHLGQSITANTIYGYPAKGMFNIGVTGTDGKTTTSSMIYHILRTAGLKTAIISTVGAIIDGHAYDIGFHVTSPDALHLQPYVKKAKAAGVKYLIIETTSSGLHQNRMHGIPFKIGVLTNISNEHLDYHKTYKNYVKAKAKLFKQTPVAILNADDKSFTEITPYIYDNKIITYGRKKNADINPASFPFKTKLIGGFNELNALAAIAVAREIGVEDSIIKKALLSFVPPTGREEIVYDKDFTVMIDFAHTPGAFEAILPEIQKMISEKPIRKKGRLIHVFGSAGQRDKYKRPEMGKLSSKYADIIILTAEDPRTEKIEDITNEIVYGISSKFDKNNLYKIPDRREAINKAIKIAGKDDIVLITGKAHEKSMNYGNGEEPWNEHLVVKEALKKEIKE